jgi:hypothetical protein
MSYTTNIPLKTFKEVSIGDKAKAITMFGTFLATASAFGMDFFLYTIDNYFVEVTSTPGTGNVVYIRATERVGVLDLYIDNIGLSDIIE